MQDILIHLDKEPDIADLVANLQPGSPVTLHCSIKAMDKQTLTLTVESAEEGEDNAGYIGGNEGSDDEEPEGGADPGDGSQSADAAAANAAGLMGGEAAAM